MIVILRDCNAHYITDEVTLQPGENIIPDKLWDKIKGNRWVKAQISAGVIQSEQEILPSEVIEPVKEVKKAKKIDIKIGDPTDD